MLLKGETTYNFRTNQKMPDYQNGKVYKIVNDVDDEEYVGSTCH